MTKSKTTFKNVNHMIDDILSDEPDRATEAKQYIQERTLKRMLVSMRAEKGLSQKDVAEMTGTTQSQISKVERKVDDDIRVKDLKAYGKAVGLNVAITFHKKMNLAQRAKMHVHGALDCINELIRLTKDDPEMLEGLLGMIQETEKQVEATLEKQLKKKVRKNEGGHIEIAAPNIELAGV